MILVLNERIENGTVVKIAEFLSRLPVESTHIEHFIYLQSRGGECWQSEAIIHMLNKSGLGINLVGFGQLCSCAFDLFFKYNGPKMLTPGTVGMYHHTCIQVDIHENGIPDYTEDKARVKYITGYGKQESDRTMKRLKFTAKEIKRVRSGKDLWFQPNRMEQLLKTANGL